MKIRIEQEHIDVAVRKDSHHCMIAEAIKAAVPEAKRIVVDLQSVRWSEDGINVRYYWFTPPTAQQALLRFDKGEKVEPFTMELVKAMVRPVGLDGEARPYVKASTKRKKAKPETRDRQSAPGNRVVRRVSAEREFGVRKLVSTESETK